MADLLDLAANALGLNAKPATDNRIDRVDQCKILWYPWKLELNPNAIDLTDTSPIGISVPSTLLAQSYKYDISNHIQSFSYSKSMGNGAGSFQLTLENSFDWAAVIKPGQWLCAFLTGDGNLPLPDEEGVTSDGGLSIAELLETLAPLYGANPGPLFVGNFPLNLPEGPSPEEIEDMKPYLRCMGIIQRVGIRTITNGDGVLETSFVITGKDFGAVFEETEVWFNGNNADGQSFIAAAHAVAAQSNRNLTQLLNDWYDIFLSPASKLVEAITSIRSFFPVQWVLPSEMVSDLDLDLNPSGQGCFGDIDGVKEFNATVFENPSPLPLSGLQGTCWERLKNLSQPDFHELFTELSDEGNPKLIFRPIPWGINTDKYPTIASVMLTYKDLTSVQPVGTPLAIGTSVAAFQSAAALANEITANKKLPLPDDSRTLHSVLISKNEIDNFDLGPDNHARANFFLVDAMTAVRDQKNAFALMSKVPNQLFPLRDESDIKRYGFRPKFLNVNTFTISNGQIFGNTPDQTFMLELNYMMKDFWNNAEDFYSGTINLAAGRNDVKLGKVIMTDKSFEGTGIALMAFYIEQYTDTYSVNADGVGSWTQNVNVTKGMKLAAIEGGSSVEEPSSKPSTFHINRTNAADGGLLGSIADGIKDPTSLLK